MKDAISELRFAIRRLRPNLLLRPDHDDRNPPYTQQQQSCQSIISPEPVTTAASKNASASQNAQERDGDRLNIVETNESSVINELQLDAASELVDAIASFVWNLDCLWDSCLTAKDRENPVHDHDDLRTDGKKQILQNNNDNRNRTNVGCSLNKEPYTEWNEEAKSLIREGYGLIATSTQSTSLLFDDDRQTMEQVNYQWQQQQKEATRAIVRTSILDLLPSLSTSASRNFLLVFLPHFVPLALLSNEKGEDISAPLWLRKNDEGGGKCYYLPSFKKMNLQTQCQSDNLQETELVGNAIVQMVDTFESLLQTDTLVPFLATMSIIFELFPGDVDDSHVLGSDIKSLKNNPGDPVSLTDKVDPGALTKNARKKCFHLCLTSLPSISKNDLPSLIRSLFTLVKNDEEGRLAMESIRTEWLAVCASDSSEDTWSNADNLVLLIGEVLIESEQMPCSNYLANGFLEALRNSLHIQHAKPDHPNLPKGAEECQSSLTSLDIIVLVALYSAQDHQRSVEAIVDSMTHDQALLFIKLMHPLIQSWLPSDMSRRRDREWTTSLLYEQLASPMISILFYIMMTSSSLVAQNGPLESALMGGLLPFHAESISYVKDTTARYASGSSYMTSDACCKEFSHLFAAVDPQRQEQIINSLLSMVSDSFVRSTPSDSPRKRNRKRHQHQQSNLPALGQTQTRHFILLAAARAACRALLLITNKHASDLSQIRGGVMDRLLLLASMSVSTTNSTENTKHFDDTIEYHLFDMNCALVISLLKDTHQDETANYSTTAAESSGSSDLLILCQKLLFSVNYMSTTTAIASSSYQHRAICGLILASRLLRCKLIPNGERGGILSWVVSVISPSSSATPLEALNPEIARWGLTFLQFASSVLPVVDMPEVASADNCAQCFPEMTRFVDTQSVCGQSDVFAQVKKMLATAAIVQMEDSLRVPSFHVTAKCKESVLTPSTFLAFAEVSPHDHLRQKKSQTTANMVVCAPYFLYGKSTRASMVDQNKMFLKSINLVADYVFDLVDRYIELGLTTTTNWNPRGWLMAKIQLPCCLDESAMEILGMKKEYSLEVDRDLGDPTSERSASWTFDLDDHDQIFQKRWKRLFTNETKSAVQNLVEFVNCLVISISVSCATLKHAHHHFEREEAQLATIRNNEAHVSLLSTHVKPDEITRLHRRKRKQIEALRNLLQFQVNKICTMQRICKNIFFALNRLYAEVCKLNTAHIKKNMVGKFLNKEAATSGSVMNHFAVSRDHRENKHVSYEKRQIPLSEVKTTVKAIEVFLSSQINHVGNSLLWNCLDDELGDAILLEHYADTAVGPPVPRVFRILRLRRNILRCLHHNIIQLNNDNTGSLSPRPEMKLQHSDSLSLRGTSRVFRMAISLTECLNDIGRRGEGNSRHNKSKFDAGLGCSFIGPFLSAHYQLLLAMLSFAIETVAIRSSMKDNIAITTALKLPSEKDRGSGYSLFAGMIQRCADSISSTPIDTTQSSAQEGTCSSNSVTKPADALIESLLRQLKHCEDATISCHIIDLISILFIHTECSRGNDTTFADTLHSVYTPIIGWHAFGEATLPYSFFKINDILIQASKNEGRESDQTFGPPLEAITSLIRTSNAFLKSKDSLTVAFVHNLLAHWSALIFEGASQLHCLTEIVGALDTFLSTAFRTSNKKNSIPLCRKFPGLNKKSFSTVFELLMQLVGTSLSLSKPCRSKKKRPFNANQIEGPYREVIWPLEVYGRLMSIFQSNHTCFPRRFILIVVKNSLAMVRLSNYQLRQCVQWRNSQHSQIGTGRDSAAVEFLQPLVDGVAAHCVGSIISFCNTMKGQPNADKRSWGTSCKNTKAIAGLQYRCKGIKETLHSICQSQNLTYPTDFMSPKFSNGGSKRKRDNNNVGEETRQRGETERSPQRKIRSRASSDRILTSSSMLELLPDSRHRKGLRYDSIQGNCGQQTDSEESNLRGDTDVDDDDSILGSDDGDSFGVIGNWAT